MLLVGPELGGVLGHPERLDDRPGRTAQVLHGL
jgi:hypothetical protein